MPLLLLWLLLLPSVLLMLVGLFAVLNVSGEGEEEEESLPLRQRGPTALRGLDCCWL